MLKKLLSKFKKEKKVENVVEEKNVIIAIHGFGLRRTKEFDNFKLWHEQEIVVFPIYDLENKEDCVASTWIKRCEQRIEHYIEQGYTIQLIGFSMGGVIATHLASKYKIERLFLLAPAFDYLNIVNIVSSVKNKVMFDEKAHKHKMPSNFTSCFMEVVKTCKDSIEYVTCPICIVHGYNDEVIPLRSSLSAYKRIQHDNKQLFIINEGKHRMMLNEHTAWETYQIFKLFMQKSIVDYNVENIENK